MFDRCLESVFQVWPESLAGGAAIVACVAVGWRLGRARRSRLVRVVSWWLQHVVRPVMESRTWFRRTVIITANNSVICAVVVVLGSLGRVAWLGVAGIGLGLGIALRLMIPLAAAVQDEETRRTGRRRALTAVGLALNVLEVPAIMLSAGLSLAQGAMSSTLDLSTALEVFALFAFPLLVVGAAGEALWMTVDSRLPKLWPGTDRGCEPRPSP